jgi:signal transduction histidine kinase
MEEAGQRYKGYLEISVIDEGIGIPEEMIPRILDPFVTSKGRSHPGLGLSIVHNIIEALDGTIQCEQNPAGGTTFKIRMPVLLE